VYIPEYFAPWGHLAGANFRRSGCHGNYCLMCAWRSDQTLRPNVMSVIRLPLVAAIAATAVPHYSQLSRLWRAADGSCQGVCLGGPVRSANHQFYGFRRCTIKPPTPLRISLRELFVYPSRYKARYNRLTSPHRSWAGMIYLAHAVPRLRSMIVTLS